MRLLLPMAYTIAFVMESATYADGKPSNPDKNFTYRLLEVDVEQDSQAHTRPATNDYADNSYQQSIIPRRTHPAYTAAAGSNGKQNDDQDRDDVKAARITTTKSKTSNDRRPTRNGNQWSSAKTEIPDDFQREISQLRIPRRVNKKKKSKSSSKKRRQQKTNADSDSYLGADMNLEDIDMDVNVDMDLDVGEEIKLGTDDVDADKDSDNGNDDGENKNTSQKYSKGRKRRRRKKPKTKAKAKENRNRDSSASSSNAAADEEDDNNSNNANSEGGGGGSGDDDDENNHQEEEEEVEEKKEKVHKVTIKKKRPYVNSTKSTSEGGDASSATKQNNSPIVHSHSHDFSKFPYQNVIGITPNRNNKGNTKSNAQTVGSGTGGGGGSNMASANAAAAAALKALQKQKNNGGGRQPHQTTKPVRPLISQENAAAMTLNPNHQESAGGVADNSAIRKGIKPRDVNLILRTKNSPRILIRRYKPLFGAYPVGVGLNLLGQRKLLGVGVYHRPRKTRKKTCKKCKKRRGKHKLYGNTYPALASDVETIHAPTTCAPHTNGQHFSNGAFGNGFSASPSPLQSTSAFGSGAANPWYAISGGQSSPFGGGDDDGGSSNPFSPYRYSPNRFEYVDENVISPRLPSQPVNTYLRMPLASFGGGGASNGGGVVEGSARSNNNGNNNDDDGKGADVYETLPLLYSTEPPVQIDSSNQALAVVTRKEPEKEDEDQGGDEGQTAAEEDDQQQQRRRRRKKPQRGKKTAAESSPVYEVHETEYEPVTGHENVEDLAAVHQVETDASLFLDEQGDHPHNSRRNQDVENDASAADQHNQQIAAAEPEEKEDEEFQDYDYFDNNEAKQEPAKEQRDDDAEEDQADDQEDQQQQQEYVDDGEGNSEGNSDTDSDVENEIENENAESAKLFDIPNADQWSYEMSESESK